MPSHLSQDPGLPELPNCRIAASPLAELDDSIRIGCLNRHVCCSRRPVDVHLDPGFLALFGAAGTGVYQHRHDHTHAINGALQRDP